MSTEKLKTLAKMLKEYCPNHKTIGCFGRITDIYNKSVEKLKELRALSYDGITFGVETGNDEALAFIHKDFQSGDTIDQIKKLEEAGISYNFFYLTDISGAGRGVIPTNNHTLPQALGKRQIAYFTLSAHDVSCHISFY